eukprot:TRINITY_DN50248_c0_g1_i1.p1 TRINITY_DN50248_c0_g1~~TRINITY_DN50248_c0_g1_i1.p1  ORF type:complete len:560 (+),score=229.82 TRINITY_DN50248_c0_g1_i1:100-1680(+)
MPADEYRSVLPSERHARVGKLRTQEARLTPRERELISELVHVRPDEFVPEGDNWTCRHPSGDGPDPGWVTRVGQEFVRLGAEECAGALVKVLLSNAVSHAEQMDAALELTLAVIQGEPSAGPALARAAQSSSDDPLAHLYRAQAMEPVADSNTIEGRIVFNALCVSAHLLRRAESGFRDKHLPSFMRVIKDRLHDARTWSASNVGARMGVRRRAEGAVKALSLLCDPLALRMHIAEQGCAALVAALLAAPGENDFASEMAANFQFVYEACMCLWLLTFSPEVLTVVHSSCNAPTGTPIIRMLNSLVKKQKRDKCVRMAMLTLKNFAKHHQEHPPLPDGPNYVKEMISVGMLSTLQMLQKRAFGDEDIKDDVQELFELLEKNAEDLSSYAQYKEEVQSGVLEWSPPHTSDRFWRENIRTFENDGYAPIFKLAEIINTNRVASASLNLQIACHDLGEFVRHHPSGRRLWERQLKDITSPGSELPLKMRLMHLIEGKEEGEGPQPISRQALLCMQKILVRKWDHLDRQN